MLLIHICNIDKGIYIGWLVSSYLKWKCIFLWLFDYFNACDVDFGDAIVKEIDS